MMQTVKNALVIYLAYQLTSRATILKRLLGVLNAKSIKRRLLFVLIVALSIGGHFLLKVIVSHWFYSHKNDREDPAQQQESGTGFKGIMMRFVERYLSDREAQPQGRIRRQDSTLSGRSSRRSGRSGRSSRRNLTEINANSPLQQEIPHSVPTTIPLPQLLSQLPAMNEQGTSDDEPKSNLLIEETQGSKKKASRYTMHRSNSQRSALIKNNNITTDISKQPNLKLNIRRKQAQISSSNVLAQTQDAFGVKMAATVKTVPQKRSNSVFIKDISQKQRILEIIGEIEEETE